MSVAINLNDATVKIVNIIKSRIDLIEKALGEEGARDFVSLLEKFNTLLKEPTKLSTYFEARRVTRKLLDLIDKVDRGGDIFESSRLILRDPSFGEMDLDLYSTLVLIESKILMDAVNNSEKELVYILKNHLVRELDDLRKIANLVLSLETKGIIFKILQEVKKIVEYKAREFYEELETAMYRLMDIGMLFEMIPPEFRGLIERSILPTIGMLTYHDGKFFIRKCHEGLILQPLSYENIILNAKRLEDKSLEDIGKHLSFFTRVLRTYIEIDYCVHAVYLDDRTYYPRQKCENYKISERIVEIPSKPVEESTIVAYKKKLGESDLTRLVDNILSLSETLSGSIMALVLSRLIEERNLYVVDNEWIRGEIKNILSEVLWRVVDSSGLEKISELITDQCMEKISIEQMKGMLPQDSLLWATIMKHHYDMEKCEEEEAIMFTEQLKKIIQQLIETVKDDAINRVLRLPEMLKDLGEDIEIYLVLDDIVREGEHGNASRCRKVLGELIEDKSIIIVENRCVTTPKLREETRREIRDKRDLVERELKEKIRKLLDE